MFLIFHIEIMFLLFSLNVVVVVVRFVVVVVFFFFFFFFCIDCMSLGE
jgi:hypothetical protein